MAKFCSKCGKELNESGKCPSCDRGNDFFSTPGRDDLGGSLKETPVSKPEPTPTPEPKKEITPEKKAEKVAPTPELTKKEKRFLKKQEKKREKKAKKKERWNAMSFGEKTKRIFLVFLIWILVLLFVSAGTVGVLTYFDVIDIPVVTKLMSQMGLERKTEGQTATAESGNGGEGEEVPKKSPDELLGDKSSLDINNVDADEYFKENGDIISKIGLTNSSQLRTGKEAYANLRDRGFANCDILVSYDENGEVCEETVISEDSSSAHPIYRAYYGTEAEEIWVITEINGIIMAEPLIYNEESSLPVTVVIVETDTIFSYDSITKQFYETIPKESSLILKKVERIDAETLEFLTKGEIDAL